MSRRNRHLLVTETAAPPSAPTTPRPVTQRFATKAWEFWTDPPGARTAAVDTVRIVERSPRTAPLRPTKGIPRARGC